jgi:peptidoglycan/xylan/chitin deacetylase (PgdA/CDA1 family)
MMRAKVTVPVLMYHSIAATTMPSFPKLTVDPMLFEEHLAALREQSIEVIPFSRVPAALAEGRHAVAITIDDGFADAADGAAEALLSHGLPATLFVPTAFIGARASWLHGDDGRRPMLSWSATAELARAGFEIGSHGKFHLAADVNAHELIRKDAAASKNELEQRLGRPALSFAYPFGYHSRRARRVVRDVGFAQACAVNDLPARAGDDRWALPRLQVDNGTSPESLIAMINWQPATMARRWAHLKQSAWRAGRRWGAGWGPAEANRIVELPQ